jgi:egghead protein (zeste-white 4 protein)
MSAETLPDGFPALRPRRDATAVGLEQLTRIASGQAAAAVTEPIASVTATRPLPAVRTQPARPAPARPDVVRAARRETRRHRIFITILMTLTVGALYALQQYLWPHNFAPADITQRFWSWAGLVWVIGAVPAVFELAGLYLWRAPDVSPVGIPQLVCWRIVSKGINTEALTHTILTTRAEMARTPLFRYVIEVVMDSNPDGSGLPRPGPDLNYLIVPAGYQTPGGTLAKARALNYALWHSPLGRFGWIVHNDEESCPTRAVIIGIANMIREEEAGRPDRPRIGQGMISYHRKWEQFPLMTLSDCIRTGSDMGRLYLSMLIGAPLFGLHGSFIVIRNDVERAVGFDIGPLGSLTEDAWWGTIAMDRGYRCRWVHGHMAEQCTQKPADFIKQRRRWFNGLSRTTLYAPARFRWRAVIGVALIAWASAPLAWAYTIGHLVHGGYINPEVRALANFSLAVYVVTTLAGLRFNMREHGITRLTQKARWGLTWLACLPAFSFMEAAAVMYGLARPAKTFHVVKK